MTKTSFSKIAARKGWGVGMFQKLKPILRESCVPDEETRKKKRLLRKKK